METFSIKNRIDQVDLRRPLSFIDYMRIKQTLALHNEYPKANITDHDDDKITYSDLYSALMYASKDMRSYTDAYTAGTMDTIGFVTDALKDNGSLSAKEYQDLLDKIIKTWGADSNGKKE